MRRTLTVVLIFSILISPAYAKKRPTTRRTQNTVHGSNMSYYAVVAETGEVVGSYNENLPLNPASNAKLVTAYCSLKTLGPDTHFETDFFSESPITDGTIHNLWVRGGGDPSLVNENLETIVGMLKAHGLKKIAGGVIVDASLFDSTDYPGRKEDNERPYNARGSPPALFLKNPPKHFFFCEKKKKKKPPSLLPSFLFF